MYYVQGTRNLGDAINPHIFSKVFGLNPIASGPEDANIFGIGSILSKGFIHNKKGSSFLRNVWRNKRKYLSSRSKPLYVFGSGFLRDERECIHPYRNYNILALRGKLSQGVVSAVLQEPLDRVVLGDPGLLMNRILDDQPVKKTKVGIIPHYVDRNNPLVDRLLKGIPGSRLIDITNDPFRTLGEIASCETIVSSALHGLIASDSFGIPNRWVKFSDDLMGDDFQFADYYSVFDMKIAPIDMRTSDQTISDRWIRDSYAVPEAAVQEVCSKLIMASRQLPGAQD